MRVFAKKTFEFTNSEGVAVRTAPLSFCDLPDWAKKTPLFKLANECGDIEVIASAQEEKKKEKKIAGQGQPAPVDPISAPGLSEELTAPSLDENVAAEGEEGGR